MSFTVNSSVGQTFDFAVSEISATEDGETVHALEIASDVQSGPSSGDGGTGMAMAIGGEATAVGEDTLAVAEVEAILAGDADMQIAFGSASFVAAGEGDGGAYAGAFSYAELTGDADRGVTLNTSVTEYVQEPEGAAWYASAQSVLFALDIDGMPGSTDAAGAVEDPPDAGEPAPLEELPPAAGYDCGCGGDGDPAFTIDGNLAWFDVSAAAVAEDSLVTVDVVALAVEDQLSSAIVNVVLGID
ncbi:hypothetical protein FO470_09270 [Starkeya sp. 3C]|uniref:Uncharacterized protein n=1 Tax=Ancylobacter moscoviensis TaxID=2597768 RepID=A0ABY3DSW4_9HYPH|nr:hypothetical protein [Ancylobacter moscoviensis]TSJ63145.1 hypothetical protein FO470_09270 [Ancylobacter moscoviensis]